MMEAFIKLLTWSHITAGVVSLVVAPAAMIVGKGGTQHRLWGRVFFWCMAWIFVTATVLSIYKGNMFLLLIGVFSFYNVVSGYRSLYHKQIHLGKGVTWYDWLAVVVATGFNLYFVLFGIYLTNTQGGVFASLSILFGAIGMLNVLENVRKFTRPAPEKNQWLFQHISGFMGGFIASVTAFSTQTMEFLPGFLVWSWPTFVGAPLIAYWIRTYKTKLYGGARMSELVELKR